MAVVLINPFDVPAETPDAAFLAGWDRAAEYMAKQPGFIGTRLHRALRPDARFRYINIAKWESPAHFQAAVSTDEFREIAGEGPSGSPSLYEVVRSL
jgi:heme-degrading monooxygenase HmoA